MSRLGRWAALAAGIILGQAILFGPSLAGRKILLPLDLLAQPGHLLPRTAETAAITPHNTILSDLVLSGEVYRQFFARNSAAGRLPLWDAVSIRRLAGDREQVFALSPVRRALPLAGHARLGANDPGPDRRRRHVRLVCAAGWDLAPGPPCSPAGAIRSLGFSSFGKAMPPRPWSPGSLGCCWPSRARARRPLSWAAPGVALLTALAILSGQPDIARPRVADFRNLRGGPPADDLLETLVHPAGRLLGRRPGRRLAAGAVPGNAAVAPRRGILAHRIADDAASGRRGGAAAGGTLGPAAGRAPRFLRSHAGRFALPRPRQPPGEHIGAFAGLLAALLLAPLAWQSGPQRPMVWLLAALGVLGMAWAVDIPGLVDLLRLPGLNMMSHNRLVFVTALAVVALAAIGLETLRAGRFPWRWWFWLPFGISIALGCWCLFRAAQLPEPLASQLPAAIPPGGR